MSALYELTGDFEALFNQYEEISSYEFTPDGKGGFTDDDGNPINPETAIAKMQAAWFDTLDGMEQEIQQKAEAVAVYIKNIKSEADMLKAEEDKLRARRKAKENAESRMKQYLMTCLEAAKLTKVDMPRAVISIRNNAESVNITDENAFIGWAEMHNEGLLRYRDPEISKTAVKALLKSGETVPYAELARSKSVIIK